MDVAILQKEIQELPDHLQDRLAAFLTALRMHRSGQDQEIFRRLDDLRPEKWSSWQHVKTDMDNDDPAAE
jgi:hemerythrin superfamily protein